MATSNLKAVVIRARCLSTRLSAVGFVLVLALPIPSTYALEELRGRAVRVTDGDTMVVEDSDGRRHKVRIVSIDAPEKGRRGRAGQPYAERSRQHLAQLVEDTTVHLLMHGYDDYGRVLARVRVARRGAEEDVDVGLAQVCAGYAWLYELFANTLEPAEQHAYRSCQAAARNGKRGLWRSTDPVPPWVWRHSRDGAIAR